MSHNAPMRRAISLLLALSLTVIGAAGLVYLFFIAPWRHGFVVLGFGSGSVFLVGCLWLYEDYIDIAKSGLMARTAAIWIFGLLASSIIGGLVADRFLSTSFDNNTPWGVLAGIFAFTCARLWFADPRRD